MPELSTLTGSRPRNDRIAILGDSRTAGCLVNDGTTLCNTSQSWISYALAISNQRAVHNGVTMNFGVPSDTLDQMLTRLPAALTSSDAGLWIVYGGTNSASSNVVAGDINTPSSMIGTAIQIQNLILNAGRICVWLDETGRGDSTFTSARLTATQLLNFNSFQKWVRSQRDVSNVYVVPTYASFSDPTSTTGDAVLGNAYDGLHPATPGAYAMAVPLSGLINSLYPATSVLCASNSDLYDATNNIRGSLVSNPLLDGTGGTINVPASGTATGSLATGWANLVTSATGLGLVYSKVASNGLNWQQVVISGTPTLASPSVDLIRSTPTAGNMTIGDVVEGLVQFEIDAGASNVKCLFPFLFDSTNSKSYADLLNARSEQISIPAVAHAGIMRIPPITLLSTNLRFSVQARGFQNQAMALSARFRMLELRKVV